jgi:predicted amidohydrolase
MKIAIAQLNPFIGDFEGTYKNITNAINTAITGNADLIVFPELVCLWLSNKRFSRL